MNKFPPRGWVLSAFAELPPEAGSPQSATIFFVRPGTETEHPRVTEYLSRAEHEHLLEAAQAEAAALRAELQELKREEKALKYQVTELMEYVAWLGGFERQAMHDSAWERRKELLTRLAASIYTGFAPTGRGGE